MSPLLPGDYGQKSPLIVISKTIVKLKMSLKKYLYTTFMSLKLTVLYLIMDHEGCLLLHIFNQKISHGTENKFQ